MKKWIKRILLSLLVLVLLCAGVFAGFYMTRFQTMGSIHKTTSNSDYNLYTMDVKYDYSLQRVIDAQFTDTQTMIDAVVKESLPLLPVHIQVPSFGCSAFTMPAADGSVLMGRNYDFKNDTSALLVRCNPKDGYASVAFAALDNVSANAPESLAQKMACLTAPFICLDGMNEKGVSIAVLTLDSQPTVQSSGKPTIATSMAIRLVLDKAATTQEAVDLLKGYDMIAANGRDYHFYSTDASGDGRVVEYDCDNPDRPLVDTPSRAVTNFFVMYKDQVLPNQHNDAYGHGRERYDSIEAILDANVGAYTRQNGWEALKAASQLPKEGDVTSNTQWSILYDDTHLTAEMALRRDWDHLIWYDFASNTAVVQ